MLFVFTRESFVEFEGWCATLDSPFHRTRKLPGTGFPAVRCVERVSVECDDGTGGGCVRGEGGMSG